jgi:predicted nucleotidyltransferase
MDETQKAIIKTLSFFSLFSYPLTKEEVFSYLWKVKIDRNELYKKLEEMTDDEVLVEKYGYHFLPDRDVSENRRQHLLESESKLKIARKAAKKISGIPFIRAIFVCNSVAFGTAEQNSDIDLFIVVKKGRLWLARFFSNLLLLLFRLRVGKNRVGDKICLSFYISENNLNLQNIKAVPEDIYLSFWLATLLPLYDPQRIGDKIIKENRWLSELLPNLPESLSFYIKEVKNIRIKSFFKNILEKTWTGAYGDLMEKQAAEAQKTKLKFSLKEQITPNIVLDDTMLKFHENDRRREYYEKWKAIYSDIKY